MRFILPIFIIFLALTSSACAGEIKIGVAGPMSGPMATFGQEIREGMAVAVHELNAQGGLLGQKITVVEEDDACDPGKAAKAAARFAEEKVAVVFGHWCTAASMAAYKTYAEKGILQIEIGAQAEELTQRGLTNIFRVSANSKAVARAISLYTIKHNPGARVAIATDSSPSMTALTGYLGQFFKNSANDVVSVETITPGAKDLSSIIDRFKIAGTEVVICACTTAEAGLLARQVRHVFFYGGPMMDSPDFVGIVGKKNMGKIVAIDYARGSQQNYLLRNLTQELWNRQWVLQSQTVVTYAAVEIYAEAVKKADGIESFAVADVLRRDVFPTALGNVRFAKNGDRIDPEFAAYHWIDGETRVMEEIRR